MLSVASEVYPLDKDRRSRRCRRSAAFGARRQRRGRCVRSFRAIPTVLEKIGGSNVVHNFSDLFGGPARLLAAATAGLDLLVLDAPHLYGRAGNPYVDRTGRDWPDNAQRFAALARAAADIGLGALRAIARRSSTRTIGRLDSRPLTSTTKRGWRRPGTVVTVHNLAFQGHFPASLLRSLMLPPQALSIDGVEYFGGHRVPEGRPAVRRPDHDCLTNLRSGNPDAGGWHGTRRLAPRPLSRRFRDPERDRRDSLEPGDRPESRVALHRHASWQARAKQGCAEGALRHQHAGRFAALRSDQQAFRAEGPRPSPRSTAAPPGPRSRPRRGRLRRPDARTGFSHRGGGFARPRRRLHRLRRAARASRPGRDGCAAGAFAIRAVRADAALCASLRLGAGRRARRRAE